MATSLCCLLIVKVTTNIQVKINSLEQICTALNHETSFHGLSKAVTLSSVLFICGHAWFVQKVSGLTTVYEVDKGYRVLTLIVFNIVPLRSHTSPNVSATVGNILRTPLSGCLIASSSNFD